MKLEPRSNVKVMFATVGSGVKLGWLTEIASPDLAKKIKKSCKPQAPSCKLDNGS